MKYKPIKVKIMQVYSYLKDNIPCTYVILWDLMYNVSTDGTSTNEPEISTGHHTLDKGKQLCSSVWCVSTRELDYCAHSYTWYRTRFKC